MTDTDNALVAYDTPAEQQYVALAEQGLAAQLEELQPQTKDFETLKVPGGGGRFWTIETLEGQQAVETVDIAPILVTPEERAFYGEETDDDDTDTTRPHCASFDGVTGFGVRDLAVIKQARAEGVDSGQLAEPSEAACKDCAWSQWGSALNNGKGQECRMRRRVIGFVQDSRLPVIVNVPTTSVGDLKQFATRVFARGGGLDKVVIRLGLEPQKRGNVEWSKITFSVARRLTPYEMEHLAPIRAYVQVALDGAREASVEARIRDAEQEPVGSNDVLDD